MGAELASKAPQPVVVRTDGGSGDTSALSTLIAAQLLPRMTALPAAATPHFDDGRPDDDA